MHFIANSPTKLSDDLMKSNSALPGGSLASKPTWSNTWAGVHAMSAFFVLGCPRHALPMLIEENL